MGRAESFDAIDVAEHVRLPYSNGMKASFVQIVIPTYNERENIPSLIAEIRARYPDADIVIVDDDSPDGTADIVEMMAVSDSRLHLLRRRGRRSFARSLIEGMLWALAREPQFVIQMDADLSHHPQYIGDLLRAADEADLVIGSRYVGRRVNVINWPLSRLFLSVFANAYVRTITRLPVFDTTGGFRCWRAEALRAIDLPSIRSEGYAFQIETLYRAHRLGHRVVEVPIIFTERNAGASKMSTRIILESAICPWLLLLWRSAPRSRA
ncbi:MAG: polyprenol monophosphomannose synthase [Blastocatellia bacterium]|nr:polyprenol monophosphomannose synthase [Blastocatellia bacterium]MCX7751958.1 polyprenol monophosphomannose synthase [Blastocatellia bacterium]MDW8167064.1 polyprenol monophosphomannose synthase [Acidobacteriota bacterium]MDW8257168.1 polyprenol monophosphomannose synthase [Acidobacteriota bacterium]